MACVPSVPLSPTLCLNHATHNPPHHSFNGMAKIAAEPFRRGLRFRTHMPGECMASECSLLCDDMHRLGLRRVLVDPTVATTYQHAAKASLHTRVAPRHWTNVTGIKLSTWAEASSAPPINWSAPEVHCQFGGSGRSAVCLCSRWRQVPRHSGRRTAAFLHHVTALTCQDIL
jgi:hypothetical protein